MHILMFHTFMISVQKIVILAIFIMTQTWGVEATKKALTQFCCGASELNAMFLIPRIWWKWKNPGELTKLLLLLKCQKNCERDGNNQLLTFRLHHPWCRAVVVCWVVSDFTRALVTGDEIKTFGGNFGFCCMKRSSEKNSQLVEQNHKNLCSTRTEGKVSANTEKRCSLSSEN